jgi:hypothetical protein
LSKESRKAKTRAPHDRREGAGAMNVVESVPTTLLIEPGPTKQRGNSDEQKEKVYQGIFKQVGLTANLSASYSQRRVTVDSKKQKRDHVTST